MKTSRRPLYETASDLKGEHATCRAWARRFNYAIHKLPMSYELDFILTTQSNRAVSFLEYKRRHFPVNRYPTVMLSLKKVMRGCELSAAAGIPSTFLVGFDDQIGSVCFSKIARKPNWIEFGGRTVKTRDSADIEPVVMIPIDEFHFWG